MYIKYLMLIFFSLVILNAGTSNVPSFENTLDKHINSIKNRNLDEYLSTVSQKNITVIFPNGKILNSFKDVSDFHKEWFSENNWTFDYEIVQKTVLQSTAIVVLKIKYCEKDENQNNKTINYILSLIFAKENNQWKLIHDQNTLIK